MTTITITVNEKTAKGKKFVEFIKTLDFVKFNESPYNPEFVKQIQKSRSSKGKVIKTEDLWKQSIKIKGNRLIYEISENNLHVISMHGHYSDK